MAAARGFVPVTCNRDATVGHIRVTFLNHVWRYVWVSRAGYPVAPAGDVPTFKAHRRRASFNLTIVVGIVADADKIHQL